MLRVQFTHMGPKVAPRAFPCAAHSREVMLRTLQDNCKDYGESYGNIRVIFKARIGLLNLGFWKGFSRALGIETVANQCQ